MGLRETLTAAHDCLTEAGIDHALIGGLGLASLGVHRATMDVDFLILGKKKSEAKEAMMSRGWKLAMETAEVMHFEGRGNVDFLLANRPLTQEMLAAATTGKLGVKCISAEGIIGLKIQAYKNDPKRELQDKADINALMGTCSLDWERVKAFAELFGEWSYIDGLRKKHDL